MLQIVISIVGFIIGWTLGENFVRLARKYHKEQWLRLFGLSLAFVIWWVMDWWWMLIFVVILALAYLFPIEKEGEQ